ncbi:MAG: ribosome-associated translation inhibitor RaiA [Patescibacteria group bacterium]|jgi:putative sigma-54 modulation protein
MRIIITGKDFKLTPSLKDYVQEKALKLIKYNNHIQQVKYELDYDHNQKSGDINRVEIWATIPGRVLQVGLKASDMHAAIDVATDKINRQLVKAKEKLADQKKRG